MSGAPDAGRIGDVLAERLGGRWSLRALNASGFCDTWEASSDGGRCFVKSVAAPAAAVLEAEADGLQALAATRTVRVPAVVGCWAGAEGVVLALEWLAFARAGDAAAGERLGRALGALHAAPPAEGDGRFGWQRDNWLGGSRQANGWSAEGGVAGWVAFVGRARLGALRDRLGRADADFAAAVDRVVAALPGFFDDGHVPRPSLIHGDLWSGNRGVLADGTPVVFDPAVSVSDAEAELAMMELFGAPPASFWDAYREAAGLHAGYRRRAGLYRLYHLLNHALLFGGGYGAQALALARRLAAGAD